MRDNYPFMLRPLPYQYDALVPYIDEETMHYHHDKHLKTYVDNLNNALKDYPQYYDWTLEELVSNWEMLEEPLRVPVRNNGGGVYNHNLYFNKITPSSTKEPVGELKKAIDDTFGSFDRFKSMFKSAGLNQFGSGWAWLVKNEQNDIGIISTANQDSVITLGLKPLVIMDVWEHAYYLQYKNARADYIDNFFHIIDWTKANEAFIKA